MDHQELSDKVSFRVWVVGLIKNIIEKYGDHKGSPDMEGVTAEEAGGGAMSAGLLSLAVVGVTTWQIARMFLQGHTTD